MNARNHNTQAAPTTSDKEYERYRHSLSQCLRSKRLFSVTGISSASQRGICSGALPESQIEPVKADRTFPESQKGTGHVCREASDAHGTVAAGGAEGSGDPALREAGLGADRRAGYNSPALQKFGSELRPPDRRRAPSGDRGGCAGLIVFAAGPRRCAAITLLASAVADDAVPDVRPARRSPVQLPGREAAGCARRRAGTGGRGGACAGARTARRDPRLEVPTEVRLLAPHLDPPPHRGSPTSSPRVAHPRSKFPAGSSPACGASSINPLPEPRAVDRRSGGALPAAPASTVRAGGAATLEPRGRPTGRVTPLIATQSSSANLAYPVGRFPAGVHVEAL